jgi:uracil-DNA glycosylase
MRMAVFRVSTDLTYADTSLSELIVDGVYRSEWGDIFRTCSDQLEDVSKTISRLAQSGATIYPDISRVFEPFMRIGPSNVRVVIIGQDPYPGTTYDGNPIAIGHAFAAEGHVPPSLRNMYKKIEQEGYKILNQGNASLSGWTEQGVLMFNRAFTVTAGNAGSHSSLWEAYTDRLIESMLERMDRVVWLLMGRNARSLAGKIRSKGHSAVECPHPSPLSYRIFFESGDVFRRVNGELRGDGIDWGRNV